MDKLDEWLARATIIVGMAVAISKEIRSWKQEQNKKRSSAPKFPKRKK